MASVSRSGRLASFAEITPSPMAQLSSAISMANLCASATTSRLTAAVAAFRFSAS